MIKFTKINQSFYKVSSDNNTDIYDLREHFSFFSEKAKHDTRFKKKQWDGKIRLVNLVSYTIPVGLKNEIEKFCLETNKDFEFIPLEKYSNLLSDKEAENFLSSLNVHSNNKKISLHDFQIDAFKECINGQRRLILSATASGKTLIIYCVLRFLLENLPEGNICICLPNVGLIEQLYNDFKDYSSDNGFDVDKFCHILYSGKSKSFNKKVLITTWQSIYKNDKDFFDQFSCFIGDEAHGCDAKSLTTIINNCVNAFYRLGFSGTLKDSKVHHMVLQSLFGEQKRVSKTSDLIEREIVTPPKIIYTTFDYSPEEAKKVLNFKAKTAVGKYQNEVKFVNEHQKRREFLLKEIYNSSGNTLVLFTKIEEQGKVLYEELLKMNTDNIPVFYIDGKVKPKEREEIRQKIEESNRSICFASYGTTSTGISIKRLHNIYFPSAYNTDVKTNQSIGRGLRKYIDKKTVFIYDYLDNLSYNNEYNYLFKHFENRLRNYIEEEFEYEFRRVKL